MEWIEKILEKGEAYSVGGSVRDELLGQPINDVDILVSGIAIDDLQALLETLGSVHLVGKNFGVFVLKPHGEDIHYEIALPRREKSTGKGHKDFEVQVDHLLPIEEDLKRRDFTMNSIAKSFRDNQIIDPWGGQEDIKNKLLRQVFEDTFKEDPLRILRGCQFAARFDLSVDDETFKGMCESSEMVSTISAERIFHELEKLLNAPTPSLGFKIMQTCGALKEILPELEAAVGVKQPSEFHVHPVFEHILAVVDASAKANDPLSVRWASLCHDLGKPPSVGVHPKNGRVTFFGHEKISQDMAKDIFKRLKAPDALQKKVATLCKEHMFLPESQLSDKALRRLIHRAGAENIEELIYLRRADNIGSGMDHSPEEWKNLITRTQDELEGGAFSRKDLAVSGDLLMKEFKLKPGPQLGEILDHLLNQVLENPSLNNKDKLLSLAKKNIS